MKLFAIKNALRKWVRNLSLQYKIQLISISCLLTLALASISISNILTQNYNSLLLDSVSASLNYANDDLTEKLENASQLSYTILSDSTLQNHLIALKPSYPNTERAKCYTQINSKLQSYYLEHQKDYISYISLYTPLFTCHTNTKKANRLTKEQIQSVLSAAHEAEGKAVWITDYASYHGLILTREIRQYKDLSLETLGTLIISIDLNQMLNSCPMFARYESFYYIIENSEEQTIYSTLDTGMSLPQNSNPAPGKEYQLINLNRRWFFALQGDLFHNGWKYTCLVSYDKIHNTLRNSTALSALLLFACIILIILVSQKLIQSFTRHFGYLIRKMQRFSESKDSLIHFEPDKSYNYSERKDEIGMLHQQFDRMSRQISDLVELNYTRELLVKEAQLKALEMQINPHFLYNTLESINWRAKSIGASTISLMVESLGNLFRAILKKSEDSFTIYQELDLVENYLTIQKCRFESMLEYQIDADPALYHASVPKMIIQPLVENAISHAMENMLDICRIEISIHKAGSALEIRVKNTGSRFEANLLEKLRCQDITPKGFGIGLLNIDQRIKLMFNASYGLKLYNENHMAVALITIPYTQEGE